MKKTNDKLWGGRFKGNPDKDFFEFQKSISYDYRLAEYDVYHSIIHVNVLREAKILSYRDARKLLTALNNILKEIKQGKFSPDLNSEDIHTDIQNRVSAMSGPIADKLHSLRSRNDQIVFDEKLFCFSESAEIAKLVNSLCLTFIRESKKHEGYYFIGYTHTQRAQVIYFSDYLLTWGEFFLRDWRRLRDFGKNLEIFIGAGALTGTSLTGENYQKAEAKLHLTKGKLKSLRSALYNVSDRDFIVELLTILSILQMHLCRLSEDLILYSTKEFDFIYLPEAFCTGSSLMPQKKNPDFLELVRGSTGKVYGNLMSVLTMLKGLPLSYNRDMQLDKEPLFSSIDTIKNGLKVMVKFIGGIKLKRHNINKVLEDETLYATELAEFLVFKEIGRASCRERV